MIRLSHPNGHIQGEIKLPSSKSISNRMLLLRQLYEPDMVLENLSEANDTQLLRRLLRQQNGVLDVQDAGTAFRFLVAYCAATSGEWIIRGTDRLQERPISELVDVLRLLGADITYLEAEGKAPLRIVGKQLITRTTLIDLGKVRSSQFISALLLITPLVKGEFNLKVNTKMASYSYVQLTISCLRRMGFAVFIRGQYISVYKQQKFDGEHFVIEPDWTSFYYWLSVAHLAREVDLFFPGLRLDNMSKERKKMYDVGNSSMHFEEVDNGLRISKKGKGTIEIVEDLNYSQFPDSAMTFAMLVPALGVKKASFRGLESLKFKECDREEALTSHLTKIGANLSFIDSKWQLEANHVAIKKDTVFPTYHDHRMAMCVAPLALIQSIIIEDESVVKKSYPHFWEDFKAVGFEVTQI
jgi:3-phosphoshikimate 1-carboxyvinyltransferase